MNKRLFKQEVQQLEDAFRSGGLIAFLETYEALRRSRLRFRLATDTMEYIVPIRHMCREALLFEEKIGQNGVASASRAMLERWKIDIRYELSGRVSQVFDHEAFLAYGNHTSGLETLIFDSLFGRTDVYQIAASFFTKIGPNISEKALLVENTPASQAAPPRKNVHDTVLDSIGAFVWPQVTNCEAREKNRATLSTAAQLIASEGAGVNIFPSGSVKTDAAWRNGLGVLTRQVLNQPRERTIYLIPVVYGLEATHLLTSGLFTPFCPTRILAQVQAALFLGTPSIFAPVAIPIEELGIEQEESVPQITKRLEQIWREIEQMVHKRAFSRK